MLHFFCTECVVETKVDGLCIKGGIPALYAIEEDMVMFIFECLFPVF